ncbi:hypothetical protein Tco_0759656, partial [Tanacetum coccineum]
MNRFIMAGRPADSISFFRNLVGVVVIRTNGEASIGMFDAREGFGMSKVVDSNHPNFKRGEFGGGRICQLDF